MDLLLTSGGYLAVSLALVWRLGGLYKVGLVLLLAAFAAALAGAWRPPAKRSAPPEWAARTGASLVGLELLGMVAMLKFSSTTGLVLGCVFAIIGAWVARSYLTDRGCPARWRFPTILACYLAMGSKLVLDPPAFIDVWYFQQKACELLLEGVNPYAASYANIYSNTSTYGQAMVGGRLTSFMYPPLTLLLDLPGYLLGDVRWSLLAAIAGAAILMVAALRRLRLPRGHPAELGAAALLCSPGAFYLLFKGWTEPYLALACAWCFHAVSGKERFGRSLPLAMVACAKQYGCLFLPCLAVTGRFSRRDWSFAALWTALIHLPFLLWDPRALWFGLVGFHIRTPFRSDSLSVLAWWSERTGADLSAAYGFGAAFLLALTLAFRRQEKFSKAALGGAAVFLAFFLFNRQAFVNYYWLTSVLFLLGWTAAAAKA